MPEHGPDTTVWRRPCDLSRIGKSHGHSPSPKLGSAVDYMPLEYLDDHATTEWRRRTTDYAYEAFELLDASWHFIQVSWLQLCLPCWDAVFISRYPARVDQGPDTQEEALPMAATQHTLKTSPRVMLLLKH